MVGMSLFVFAGSAQFIALGLLAAALAGIFAAAGRFEIPALVTRTLRFVPPAVLSAIVALLVGRLTGNMLAVIVSGMGVFWLWQMPFVRGLLGF
ncbi:MAG TPA: hypothetical protein VMV44_07665 [Rectinemataceae bacterium]|nr:hypothetical protein [Rectinemataceae bacterium]